MHARYLILLTTALTGIVGTTGTAWAQSSSPAAQEGDDIVVSGYRKSLEDAIEIKRQANSIVDVISAEDVGKLPDSNIADSLARLPGVTVDRQFGEGEQLSIAGVEPALNRVLIDGHSVASADWGGNPSDRSSRTFNYSLLSPTIISRATVYKTPEARLQEGSIGATVDITTQRPLDLAPHTIRATAGGEYNDRAERGSFRGSALYSWHNEAGTIGILGSVNYDKEQLSRAGMAVYWYRTGAELLNGYPTDASGNIVYSGPGGTVASGPTINGSRPNAATIAEFSSSRYASMIAREFFKQERERIGFSGAIQIKPADNFTITGTALVIRGNYDNLSNSEYTYGYDGSMMQSATMADGVITSASFALPAGATTGATGQLDTNFRRTRVKNDSYAAMFEWTPENWEITANAGYTKATGGKDPEYLLDFRTQQSFTAGAVGRNSNVVWANPGSDATKWLSNYTALGGENITTPSGSTFVGRQIGGIPSRSEFTSDKEKFGEINFKRAVNLGPINEILFGGRYADHNNNQVTYGSAVYTNQNFTLADLNPYVLNDSLYNGLGTSGNGVPYATLDRDALVAALEKYGNLVVDRGLSKGNYFDVNEKIVAGYVQANFKAGKFRGNIGGRFVRTRDEASFYVNDASLITETRVDDRFLPSINLIYDAGDTVVLRAAAAKVIARPRYSDLAAATSLDDRTRSGSGGNPDLKPYAATNFGLSAEWYFARGSFLAGEIFYRDISNYVTNATADVLLTNPVTGIRQTYNISTPVNGGKGTVTGFSLSGNANLIWGFGIQGNYTFADAETGIQTGLPYLSRNTVTVVPYFVQGPLEVRLSYNRRSKYFYRFGRQSSQDYTDAYQQVDLSASLNLTDNVQLTASASNLLDETYYQYSSSPEFPTSVYKNGRVFSIAASAKF